MISITIDKALLIQLVNFVLLVFILNALLFKPIREAIKKREKKIHSDQDEIAKLQAEAEDRLKQFQLAIEDAKKEGLAKKEALRKAATEKERSLLAKVHGEVEEELKKVKSEITKEMQQTREKLKGEIKVFASDIAEKILGRPLSHG